MAVAGNLTTWNCTFVNNTRSSTLSSAEAGGGAIRAAAAGNLKLYSTYFVSNTAMWVDGSNQKRRINTSSSF
jgi:hypothetical protein